MDFKGQIGSNHIWKPILDKNRTSATNGIFNRSTCKLAEVMRRQIAMLYRRNMISTKVGNMEYAKPTNTAAPPAQLRSPQ